MHLNVKCFSFINVPKTSFESPENTHKYLLQIRQLKHEYNKQISKGEPVVRTV